MQRRRFNLALLTSVLAGGFTSRATVLPGSLGVRSAAAASRLCPVGEERLFLRRINQYRRQKGRRPLVLSKSLTRAANVHSQDMTIEINVDHSLSDGTTAQENLIECGYPARAAWGEILTWGPDRDTAAVAFSKFKGSPGHNREMLRRDIQAIGISLHSAPSTSGKYYWAVTFGGVKDEVMSC